MIKVIKHMGNDGNIDFEFLGADCWEDFEIITDIIVDKYKASIINKLEGIYSKHVLFSVKERKFRLMYHEDTGNCLCPVESDEISINYVMDIAYSIVSVIEEKLGQI